MSTSFYDTTIHGNEDTVRLLSNPLNNENLPGDEFEFTEEDRLNPDSSLCSACSSLILKETTNHDLKNLDSDNSPTQLYGECHHCHQFAQAQLNSHSSSKLILALLLCVLFMTAEMIGGYIAGSVAVVSDGAHLLTDVVGFLISLIAIATSKKQGTKNFNLGFHRLDGISEICDSDNGFGLIVIVEILATVTSILLIWIMTAIFIYIAANRLIKGDYSIDVNTMIVISSLGVIVNILMFSVLHGSWHISHNHTQNILMEEKSKSKQNINVQAAIVHVIGDLVQSVGVFISSIIIKFYPEAKFMDPICTFVFSIIVICSTLKLFKDSLYILMDGFPNSIEYNKILISLQNLKGVRHVHSLCVWSLTVEKHVLIVHLAVDDTVDRDKILFQAQRIVSAKFGINHHTIQIEKYHSRSMQTCQSC